MVLKAQIPVAAAPVWCCALARALCLQWASLRVLALTCAPIPCSAHLTRYTAYLCDVDAAPDLAVGQRGSGDELHVVRAHQGAVKAVPSQGSYALHAGLASAAADAESGSHDDDWELPARDSAQVSVSRRIYGKAGVRAYALRAERACLVGAALPGARADHHSCEHPHHYRTLYTFFLHAAAPQVAQAGVTAKRQGALLSFHAFPGNLSLSLSLPPTCVFLRSAASSLRCSASWVGSDGRAADAAEAGV
eukprot:1061519-Pelagomonas_calceolata.AAC.9